MSKNDLIEDKTPSLSGNIDFHYKSVPMDLNSSPLEYYFKEALSTNAFDSDPAAVPKKSSIWEKTLPVSIPGSLESKANHDQKKKHHKRRRKFVSHTFPDDNLTAVMERKQQQQQGSSEQTKQGIRSECFIVGSLQEKPPVPWPTALTATPDSARHQRLKNRQTVNWPLIPESIHRGRREALFNDNDEDVEIFNMEDDYYNSSYFDEENPDDDDDDTC